MSAWPPPAPYPRTWIADNGDIVVSYVMEDGNVCHAHITPSELPPLVSPWMLAERIADGYRRNVLKPVPMPGRV